MNMFLMHYIFVLIVHLHSSFTTNALMSYPLDSRIPLIPNPSTSNSFCNPCQKQHSGPVYSSSLCNFNINVECAWSRPILENKGLHQHPFTLFWKQDDFICDACGVVLRGNYISYICSPCNFMVHKHYTKLPRIIRFSRHASLSFSQIFSSKTRPYKAGLHDLFPTCESRAWELLLCEARLNCALSEKANVRSFVQLRSLPSFV
ncbi:hypothetical protein GQ457_01G044820 [Hibiscus cannabinus]